MCVGIRRRAALRPAARALASWLQSSTIVSERGGPGSDACRQYMVAHLLRPFDRLSSVLTGSAFVDRPKCWSSACILSQGPGVGDYKRGILRILNLSRRIVQFRTLKTSRGSSHGLERVCQWMRYPGLSRTAEFVVYSSGIVSRSSNLFLQSKSGESVSR